MSVPPPWMTAGEVPRPSMPEGRVSARWPRAATNIDRPGGGDNDPRAGYETRRGIALLGTQRLHWKAAFPEKHRSKARRGDDP